VRTRSLAFLSATALAAVLLAGCSSPSTESEPTPSATTASSDDLCGALAASGAASDAVTIEGEPGTESVATFESPLEVAELQATVDDEGSGDPAEAGDYLQLAVTGYNAETGEKGASQGYDETTQPQQISVESGLPQLVGCPKPGSRFVAAVPASAEQGAPAQVWVIDVLDVIAADDFCSVQEPGDEFPTVEFSADGVPTITVPATEPPAELELEVLKEGDGEVVEPGDNVTVDYTGVKWSDGTVFDSSWEKGEPATFSTNGVVVGFQRALEGQTVGSQILVSIPPMCGYGDASSGNELGGETLVFVIEIISTEHYEG